MFVLVINTALKLVTIRLIKWIGYDTWSEMFTKITNATFIALFFNTGIVILLVNANLSEVSPGYFFNSGFADYTPIWYTQVGTALTTTLLYNVFIPPVSQLATSTITSLTRKLDQGLSPNTNRYSTKCTQPAAYIDLYSGAEYLFFVKYSSAFNVTFVTMMYGAGMPILFPIAALNYISMWLLERYNIAYNS